MSNQIAFRGLNSTLGATCGTNTDSCDHDGVNTLLPSTTKVVGTTGHQFLTVHVWDSVGCETDNIARVYKTGECVFSEGKYYFSKTDMNVTKPTDDSANWSGGYTLCQLLSPGSVASFKYTPKAINAALATGAEKPVAALVKHTESNGITVSGTEFVLPMSGTYEVIFASNMYWVDATDPRKLGTYSDGSADVAGFRMNLNGNPIDGLAITEWGFARRGQYHYKTLAVHVNANAGDRISAETFVDDNLIGKMHQGPIKGTIKYLG